MDNASYLIKTYEEARKEVENTIKAYCKYIEHLNEDDRIQTRIEMDRDGWRYIVKMRNKYADKYTIALVATIAKIYC